MKEYKALFNFILEQLMYRRKVAKLISLLSQGHPKPITLQTLHRHSNRIICDQQEYYLPDRATLYVMK